MPLAAFRSDDVAFVVTVGASAMDAGRTQLWSNRTYLAHAGVSPALIGPLGHNASRMLIAAGLFGDTAFDPATALADVDQPLLGVFAEHDRSTAPGESLTAFREALDRGGNAHYTLRVVPDADHTLRRSADGFDRAPDTADFATGHAELMTSWVNALADGPPRPHADPPPAQSARSEPVAPLAWYESPWLHVLAVVLMLPAFLSHPVVTAVRRWRGRREPVRHPVGPLSAAGIVTVLGALAYLFRIVHTGANQVGTTVLGRPLPWLALQLAAFCVLAGTALTITRWRTFPAATRLRLAAPTAAGVVFLPWAAYWGLLTV
ncbi:alpha/beta hydrolase family protein [Saccharothrix hoggarensis]|uniref:Alpha/beta hydrolase n=1 Tax=Saccharothrix hoggarensis TaxID=913853 RepID=A0ABW3R2B7_9PSEU